MKVIDRRTKTRRYGELSIGRCFELDGEIFIKTNIVEDKDNNDMYAVNLVLGTKYEIGCKVEVIPIEAELLLK